MRSNSAMPARRFSSTNRARAFVENDRGNRREYKIKILSHDCPGFALKWEESREKEKAGKRAAAQSSTPHKAPETHTGACPRPPDFAEAPYRCMTAPGHSAFAQNARSISASERESLKVERGS